MQEKISLKKSVKLDPIVSFKANFKIFYNYQKEDRLTNIKFLINFKKVHLIEIPEENYYRSNEILTDISKLLLERKG